MLIKTMETRKGNILLFLTVLLCSTGVFVNTQDTTTAATTTNTSAATNASATGNTTVTPTPTNATVNSNATSSGGNSTEQSNSTSGNITSSTPSSDQSTSANNATATSTMTSITTTMQPTTVRVYCTNTSCEHGNCTNMPSSYVCVCEPGWTGDRCDDELVLWPDYTSSLPSATNTSKTLGSIPFVYFNRAVTELNVNTRGYASFGEDFISANTPSGTEWPYVPDLFGIYWADIEILNSNSSFFYVSSIERVKSNDMNSSSLVEYVKTVVNESNFEPLYLLAATWVNVMPRPAANFSNDKATFQLILASDTQFSYVIRNYQKVWQNTEIYGRPRVSAACTAENGSQLPLEVPKNKTGKLLTPLFTTGTPTKNPYDCVQKTLEANSSLSDAVRSLPSCPCQVSQVKVDGWFENVNSSTPCYQSVLPGSQGLKQQCCYNRFGLLNVNSKEASVPVQVNVSDGQLQLAFDKCCNGAPQLCSWFYNRFPSSVCSAYSPPYIGASFGKTYTVRFDNNTYSFNGLGDFVLFKSGEVEIQIKSRINANSNTTSIEALAVKMATNTSNFQFYMQSTALMWNFTSSPVAHPDMSTYKIQLSQSDITLWLPTVIITVANKSDSLSCSIKVSSKHSDSQGLLGSGNINSTNDFRFKNGTSKSGTADKLGIGVINEFALSWQVLNATESLFDNPSIPANDTANSTTRFMPSLLPTNVIETLGLFSNLTVRAEVGQLCGDVLFCVQEYYTSNSNTSAVAVLEQAKTISAKKQPPMMAPMFSNTDSRIIINGSSLFTLNLTVQNGMAVTFSNEITFQNISGTRLENGTFTWNVSADLTQLRMVSYPKSLKFYATNEVNLSAEYAPAIRLCLCEKSSQCQRAVYPNDWALQYHFTSDISADGNINTILCDCGGRAEGRFCETPVDVCTNCFNRTTCNATKLIDYCSACPSGYGGDGKVCRDIDECLNNNGGCEQMCTNTLGSFNCSCEAGFRQNGTRCTDIDECLEDINVCRDYLKVCTNKQGSYSCSCIPSLVGVDKCIRAPFSFVGEFNLANTEGQEWNTSLNDKNSAQFKALAVKVATAITTRLVNGNIGTNDTLLVEILSFAEVVQNATRIKRQAATSDSHVIVLFVIHLANSSITADTINAILRDGNTTVCNGSCPYQDIIILSYPQLISNANLCAYPQIHKCDESTTMCVQEGLATNCQCKAGYERYPSDFYNCRDTNECAENATKTCPETGVCNNTAGSYMCGCSEGKYWDANNSTCAADGCAAQPCKNGACSALQDPTGFTCKCNSGWEGSLCDNEDAETYRMRVAVICVSVILGVLCLVLLIILIVICVRQRRTLENDSYTNSRYSEAEHLPRVKIAHRPGTEMAENGQSNTYERLNSGSTSEKNTFFGQHAPTPDSRDNGPKGVYQNRAYEEDVGERL